MTLDAAFRLSPTRRFAYFVAIAELMDSRTFDWDRMEFVKP